MLSSPEAIDLLLVEDNPQDLELILRALRKAGHNPEQRIARDGQEALDLLFGAAPVEPRVILLDLKLPRVSGIELLRRLKEDARTRSIPVVVLTSSPEQRDLAECYRLGANSYVVKPVEFAGLSAVVQQVGGYWLRVNRVPRDESS